MKPDLTQPITRFRSHIARGRDSHEIDRTGGEFGAGFIPGFAVITRGEALGHGLWIDQDFLKETAAAINATGDAGTKCRFTHPDMSGDGLGSLLGRVDNARVEGDRVLADLHLLASAHQTPDGDLAGYTLDLAEEAPDAFGASISFSRDGDAEVAFNEKHSRTETWNEPDGTRRSRKMFQSPDKLNTTNLRHARLKALHATDIVDEPAANPHGS